MATLIRLKQIESGSALQTAADVNTDFSQSVIDIVVDNVEVILPQGTISSSAQLDILGYATTSSLDAIFATDAELSVTSSQIIDQGEF